MLANGTIERIAATGEGLPMVSAEWWAGSPRVSACRARCRTSPAWPGGCRLDRLDVLAGITAALSVESTSPDVVALEARKGRRTTRRSRWPRYASRDGRVVILAAHRSATVPADERPLPSVDKYDILLGRESS